MYPENFKKLIEIFEKLPGVGVKTAQRYAFNMLEKNEDEIDEYISTLIGLKRVKKCPTCGFLMEDECLLCADKTKDHSKIMVLAYPQDVAAIEKTEMYHGQYHVLNGLLSPNKGIYPEDLNINTLLERINESVEEIIIATSPTMDGEMTALYLDKILKDKNILVTRLANGLPMGANLDYADELTLIKAMNNRTKITQE